MAERRDLPIDPLSGGQRKRVSIGVELLTNRASSSSTSRPPVSIRGWKADDVPPPATLRQGRTMMLITHATQNVSTATR